jgi:hypothetical protein
MDVQPLAAMRVKSRALQKQVGEGEADVLCELKLLLVEGVAIIRLSTRATFDSHPPIVFTHSRHCMPTAHMCKAYPSCASDGWKRQTNPRRGSKQARTSVGRGKHCQRPANNGPCMGNGVRFERVRCEVAQPAPLNPIKLKACMSDIPTCMEKMCTCAGEVTMAASQKLHAMRNTHLLWNQLANARF